MLQHETAAINHALNDLDNELRSSLLVWNDAMRLEFEAQYWMTITEVTSNYLRALNELEDTLTTVEQFVR